MNMKHNWEFGFYKDVLPYVEDWLERKFSKNERRMRKLVYRQSRNKGVIIDKAIYEQFL